MAANINPISTSAAFFLPIYWDKTPSGKRISAPDIIGTEIINPFCAGLRLKYSLINGAMAPFSTQIAKQKSKYRNEANNVGGCPAFKKVLKFAIHLAPHT